MKNYTRKEVAELFDVTILTVIQWENSGKIESYNKERGVVVYSKYEVSKLLIKKKELLEIDLKKTNESLFILNNQ